MLKRIKYFYEYLWDKMSKDDILSRAASLAFYTTFALAPLVILLVVFLSSLRLNLQQQLIAQIIDLMGREAGSVLEAIITKAEDRADLTSTADWWGVITLGVSASVIFAHLQGSLNVIFQAPEAPEISGSWRKIRQFIGKRLVCFGMVLTFVMISIVSLVVSAGIKIFVAESFKDWVQVAHLIVSLAVYSGIFAAIFKWMPDIDVTWKAALKGSLVTAGLFVVGKWLIGLYLGTAAVGSAYGAAGSLVVLLFWVYYSSIIILFGAETASFLFKRRV